MQREDCSNLGLQKPGGPKTRTRSAPQSARTVNREARSAFGTWGSMAGGRTVMCDVIYYIEVMVIYYIDVIYHIELVSAARQGDGDAGGGEARGAEAGRGGTADTISIFLAYGISWHMACGISLYIVTSMAFCLLFVVCVVCCMAVAPYSQKRT
jgi:hypothetical protein